MPSMTWPTHSPCYVSYVLQGEDNHLVVVDVGPIEYVPVVLLPNASNCVEDSLASVMQQLRRVSICKDVP